MPRTEDFPENMENDIKHYKDLMLRKAEDFMSNHERQKLIEINANLSRTAVFKALITKLESMAVGRAAVPLRLQGEEGQDEIPEDTETDDLLRTLAATETIAPGFRWRRSRWGRLCPVALYEGNIMQGSPQFAVSFLDKIYVMSSLDALEKFMRNPRPYLLEPQPRSPCKLCILGPPLSGKTTLANRIAKIYSAKVFDVEAMMRPKKEAQTEKMLKDVKDEARENAIARVTAIVQQEKLAAEQARREEEEEEKNLSGKEDEADEAGGGEEVKENEDAENVQGDKEKERGEEDEGEEEKAKEADDKGAIEIKEEEQGEEDSEKQKSDPGNLSREESIEIVVDENHPQVAKAIQEALDEAMKREINISAEEYVEVLEAAIYDYYAELQQKHPMGPIAGRWILDNFPQTRDQFNIMVERGILPDNLVCLKDNSEGGEMLLKRWYRLQKEEQRKKKNLPEESSVVDDEMPPKSAESNSQRLALTNFDKNWTSLQGVVRSINNIEPILIDSALNEDEIEAETVEYLEAPLQYKGWEYTGMDQDEEEEDLAAEEEELDGEEDEDDDVFNKDKRKPFGDTRHYCPVVLKENNVLWPGQPECACKYRERVYYFSSPEARVKFLEKPLEYLAEKEPLKPPSLRLVILGAKGSGKTLVGRELARKFGVFHISFHDRLQELIIAKTKKRIGRDYPEEDEDETELVENEASKESDGADTEKSKQDEQSDNNKDLSGKPEDLAEEEEEVEFTDIEANIRDNLLENVPLTSDTLESMLPAWWNTEPFSSTGFILEGFPRTTEEVRFLAESGLYPDCVINLATEENDIIDRLMPPLLEKWRKKRDRRLEKKQKQMEIKAKKKEEERSRRIEEKVKEIAARKAENLFGRQGSQDSDADSNEGFDEDEEEEEEDIEAVVDAEMAEEEEDDEAEEEEESEEDAIERIKLELTERFDDDMERISNVQEIFEEFLIPRVDIEAGRKPKIVQYVIEKNLKPMIENRDSLFDRCHPVSSVLARKMLIQGYKQPSRFGKWCPVQLSEGNVLPPYETSANPLHPAIYRQHVYFFASEHNRDQFMMCPFKYIHQLSPKPIIPIRLALVGPPKSGKTTLAERFAKEYGVVRISAGEALRNVTENQSKTELAQEIVQHLKSGTTVPDELVIQALDVSVLDVQCQVRGFILDGFPVTENQIQGLTEKSLIPYKVLELKVNSNAVFERADFDRQSPLRVLPLHDSHMITAIKLTSFLREIGSVRSWYERQHRNWISINGQDSKWKVWNAALLETKAIIKKIQTYLDRSTHDQASSINELCVTPSQLTGRIGIFGHYCPVSYVDRGELVDCESDDTQKFAAEFRGHYYKLAGEKELGIFLENPERYTPPDVEKTLPPAELLPRKLTASDVKEMFPVQIEMLGYCPVTYLEGDLRYEALVPGDVELVAKYKEKLYLFASEDKRETFMRLPEKYSSLKLPHKLPPKRDPLSVTGLPMLGYMEQTLEFAIRKAATAVGCFKPKFPFLTAKQSALLYMAYHLKANNPKANDYVRTKYKKKLEKFENNCELIRYLGKTMTRKFKEPEDRPIDFDYKLSTFISLKQLISGSE